MTCIVGTVSKGKVWIGGDSCASDGSEKVARKDPKVFELGNMVIGYAGSFRFGQLLRYKFAPPGKKDDQEDYEYLVTDWLDALRHTCKEGGLTKVEDNEETLPDSSAIIGYNGRLFVLDSDLNLGEPVTNFYAIGAGSAVAFGALNASWVLSKKMQPRRRLTLALESASMFAVGVEPPFVIISN